MLRIIRNAAASPLEQKEYVPLKRVSVDATIKSFAADVIIKQVFCNDETTPIEAVYCFPLEEQAAVYAFIARIDDREIVAHLKEKKEAQKEYSTALRQGHGAYLLEQDEKSQDNFIINVGALQPGKECHISISYVSELDLVQNGTKIRFVVPTTIAPRYNPNRGSIGSPVGITSKYIQTTPYTVEFRCLVDKVGISSVTSRSHPIRIDVNQPGVYVIEFAQQNVHLDRDILLDIDLVANRSNTILVVERGAVMAAFTPHKEDCQRAQNNTETINEFIFLVDCSGSMSEENKIELARQAIILFLKSLPVNCHFNIIQFGSHHYALFDNITTIYNEENARTAKQLINAMRADLGGTELLTPLQWLEAHPPQQGRARQVFLLTDGQISNVDQVLDLCRSMVSSTRIFSFGLGHSPSRSLVKGLARATNGRFVFIPPNSSVDVYVGEQLQKALQSSITNVRVKWNLKTSVMSVPTQIPPVYTNDRLIVYALATDPSSMFDHDSSVELFVEQHRLGKATIDRVPNVSNDSTIARLAAKALILELQHSKLPSSATGSLQSRFQEFYPPSTINDETQATKKRIIELSLKYHILSPHTAFVGIEKHTTGENSDMVLREVPIQISVDNQHLKTSHIVDSPKHQNFQQWSSAACAPATRRSTRSIDFESPAEGYMNLSMSCHKNCGFYGNSQQASRSIGSRRFNLTTNDDEHICNTEARNLTPVTDRYCSPIARTAGDALHKKTSELKDSISSLFSHITQGATKSTYETEQKHANTTEKEKTWPIGDENIVRYLINEQQFNGLWDLDAKYIEELTSAPLESFPHHTNRQVLVSAIVIVTLETRFASLSNMWHGVVQKARKHLLDLLGNDGKQLDLLFKNIEKQL